ncbi:probable G-protein coupled receptor CG31760 isoform X2 [Cotesia glomerata]|uniref:probable G-protein coupled receptor CG31760 isoform X2 n=1 Tax=Cotesia glomerata TaxID=32391 RepID=UPI001D004AFA|nr:probable G-protein coupled receptor CG31760 isoform X2 [Cotesia glomerata]
MFQTFKQKGMEYNRSWHVTALHLTTTTMTTIAVMTYVHATMGASTSAKSTSLPPATSSTLSRGNPGSFDIRRAEVEEALDIIEAASSNSLGEDCASTAGYKSLPTGAALDPRRLDVARQKIDMAAMMMQNLGSNNHPRLLDAVARSLLSSVNNAIATRVVVLNASTDIVIAETWLKRMPSSMGEPIKLESDTLRAGYRPHPGLPWFEKPGGSTSQLRSPKFVLSAPIESYMGWWTVPYLSCKTHQWIISYSVYVRQSDARTGTRDFLSVDIDISGLEVNQCDQDTSSSADSAPTFTSSSSSSSSSSTSDSIRQHLDTSGAASPGDNQMESFSGSHKCHNDTTQCEYRGPSSSSSRSAEISVSPIAPGWVKGAYVCRCRDGFYSLDLSSAAGRELAAFDGVLVEAAWREMQMNKSDLYDKMFRCTRCAVGCVTCTGPEPCLATYHWPFRITLLTFSIFCSCGAVLLIFYVYKHRKLKVFKVASPIFLSITLLGCAIMYLEMAAIFPVLDVYSCIATKWTRHLGFCISYTALLMKTWRVSLTYRVKSAHKVKLTDKQLLQWMIPILLVMIIYLSTWTLSAPPDAHVIADSQGLKFYQCNYNWWDHSLAIGEILFLAWGIRVCYNVRNAESLFNEARLISYAIYNIAGVNTTMIAIHLFIFPHAGPDIKYTLGFLRTQLSTTVTVGLVFGPKVLRVLRGHGDQWDSRARARGITASFSLNGIRGLVAEETTDLFQENEELKEEIQKLAAQIEFMKIVHMEMHNRHIKPKMGGYFSTHGHNWGAQSPNAKNSSASFIIKTVVERGATAAAAAAVEDSTFPSGSLHRARRMELLRERKAARERERENQETNRQQQSTVDQSEGVTSTSGTSSGEHV